MYAHGGTVEDKDPYVQAGTVRRVWKGTCSCRECKRRKMKCTLDPLTNDICNGCRRRGSKCLSQGQPRDKSTLTHSRTPVALGQVAGKPEGILNSPSPSFDCPSTFTFSQFPAGNPEPRSKKSRLTQFLHQSLPSRKDLERICNACHRPFKPVLAHEILTVPYADLQGELKTPESLLETPRPDLHPVLIARYMLQTAVFLQHLHPKIHEEIEGLSESPRITRERLADRASSLVTTNNELLGSIEGLECIMIECMYEANVGNLRRSWVASRRAISIAQLMDLDRSNDRAQYKVLDPETKYHPQHMWFRIMFLDRHLSLILGLPQGPFDHKMASDMSLTSDTHTGRLERLHCVLASKILERNESGRASDDLALTTSLDFELQKAARKLPSKWWLAPNLDNLTSTDSEALFWDTRRLFAQMLHYNLLNQLHLPYMLRCPSTTEYKYFYSRDVCVNASREVLSRFITLRSFNRVAYSWSCRIVDFLARMAALTLLPAHLHSHSSSESHNLLAHQYITGRAMIEQAHENMKEVNSLNSDALSARSADLLHSLLTIEDGTADDYKSCARKVSVYENGTQTAPVDAEDEATVRVHIPYFGIIKISRESMSKEDPKCSQIQSQAINNQDLPISNRGRDYSSIQVIAPASGSDDFVEALSSSPTNVNSAAPAYITPPFSNDFPDSLWQHEGILI